MIGVLRRYRAWLIVLIAITSVIGCSAESPLAAPGAGVVGLGDSVPAATACGCTSYVVLVAHAIAQSLPGPTRNLSVPGETSAELLAQLSSPTAAGYVGNAGVVLVTIGANDFDAGMVATSECARPEQSSCYGADLARLRLNMNSILSRLSSLGTAHDGTGHNDTRVLVTGYWNVFLDGTVGKAQGPVYVHNSDALTRAVNAVLSAAAADHGDDFLDLYAPFKSVDNGDDTRLLAPDGDHPSAAGHQLIAASALKVLQSPTNGQ